MQVPILKQGRVLIATVQSSLTDTDLQALGQELVARVGPLRIRGVVLDVSLLDVIDSYSVRMIRTIADTVRLRGAQMVVVGIQPDVAFSMVQLGLNLKDTWTALDLEDGFLLLDRAQEAQLHAR
jgi:rsbT antagonist protein RsbS